eukprot:917886_1
MMWTLSMARANSNLTKDTKTSYHTVGGPTPSGPNDDAFNGRVSHGDGLKIFILLPFVIYVLSCYATIIYGIYAGQLLHDVWATYNEERINADCSGAYDKQFTVLDDNGERQPTDTIFTAMVTIAVVEGVVCLMVILCGVHSLHKSELGAIPYASLICLCCWCCIGIVISKLA